MVYKTKFLQELIEYMASCDKLGLTYVIQKEYVTHEKWFKKTVEPLYSLAVTQYVEEEDSSIEQDSLGGLSGDNTGEVQG